MIIYDYPINLIRDPFGELTPEQWKLIFLFLFWSFEINNIFCLHQSNLLYIFADNLYLKKLIFLPCIASLIDYFNKLKNYVNPVKLYWVATVLWIIRIFLFKWDFVIILSGRELFSRTLQSKFIEMIIYSDILF